LRPPCSKDDVMHRIAGLAAISVAFGALGAASLVATAQTPAREQTFALATAAGLRLHGVDVSPATYQGRQAVRLVNKAQFNGEAYAAVEGPVFQDGTIEVDLAGRPQPGASEGARGFVGVAFRVRSDDSAFECFYIRPTNGRADDQLRRNHATQYVSEPGFPWQKLRQESPGVYESYVDLVSGEWTHLRVAFNGKRAQLYVNQAPQPVLIVNDLKQAPAGGGVALWIGSETEAFFRNLIVKRE
jgi:hypothetical protein